MNTWASILILLLTGIPAISAAQEDLGYKVFQFPSNQIPTIDGKTDDWKIFPEEYAIGTDALREDLNGYHIDTTNLNVKVRVGWVKGFNRLYFLYEAYDNYWDFSGNGLRNDTFEIVIDGDLSGGPFISGFHPYKGMNTDDAYFSFHGVHAQNYHIFTPAAGKDWALVWGSQPWTKSLPFALGAYDYSFKHGEPGKLVVECWLTPFDYAGNNPERSIQSQLFENKEIGLAWAIIDYDDAPDNKRGFWTLSSHQTMYGNASELLVFRLLPLDANFRKPIEADWSFKVVDMDRRLVAFKDESYGEVTAWHWDFGDGTTSTEHNPVHQYKRSGRYVVVLNIKGPKGKAQMSKVWDVAVK